MRKRKPAPEPKPVARVYSTIACVSTMMNPHYAPKLVPYAWNYYVDATIAEEMAADMRARWPDTTVTVT